MTKCIMIVDDSPEILILFGGVCRRWGYDVLATEDSTKVIDMLKESTPDLFILDVMMPDINGIELCRLIRDLPEHKQTPVIIISAYSSSDIVEQTFAAGANDYMFKPIDSRIMESKVHKLLEPEEA